MSTLWILSTGPASHRKAHSDGLLTRRGARMRRAVLKEAVKRFPWLANVTLYGCLFAGGDLAHQLIAQKEHIDWSHTRNVAIVAISFHGNFNYFWLRALEKRFPGKSVGMVFRKLLLDQSFASPLATSVFYTGKSSHTAQRFSVCVRVLKQENKFFMSVGQHEHQWRVAFVFF